MGDMDLVKPIAVAIGSDAEISGRKMSTQLVPLYMGISPDAGLAVVINVAAVEVPLATTFPVLSTDRASFVTVVLVPLPISNR